MDTLNVEFCWGNDGVMMGIKWNLSVGVCVGVNVGDLWSVGVRVVGVGVCVGVGLDVGDWGLTDEMGTL